MLAQGGVGVVYKAEDNHRSCGRRSRPPQAVTALRSTLILGSILNTLDADELHKAMQVEEGDASLWKILKGLTTKEARQVAMVGVNLMNVIGKAFLNRRALEKPLFSP